MANIFDNENPYTINQNVGFGAQNPATAKIHIGASNGLSNTAPFKLTAGTNLSTIENGAIEFDGTHLYISISGTRLQLDQQASGGGVSWGTIIGTLSNQTDLNTALNTRLIATNNLSDLSSASTARTNLGLGSAATQNTSAFLQSSNNLSDISNAGTARTNLGLGSAAVLNSSTFLQVANNLSDVNNSATARSNISAYATTGGTISGAVTINSNSANSLIVGPNGTTNPTLNIDSSIASTATGLNIQGQVAGSGIKLSVLSSGTNEGLIFNTKGTGNFQFTPGSNSTTAFVITNAANTISPFVVNTTNSLVSITSSNSVGFAVGRNGSTNPMLQISTGTNNAVTGLNVTGAASGGGLAIATISSIANENLTLDAKGTGTISLASVSTGGVVIGTTISSYKGVSTAALGIPSIYGYGRFTAQTAAVVSVASYTNGAADGSFLISANVNITSFTAGTFNTTVTYTDETNTSRTLTLNFSSITGTLGIALAAAGAFEGIPAHIRVKASTAITIATTGTFTSLTYNVEGLITQIA
jgi:hypothetical protein